MGDKKLKTKGGIVSNLNISNFIWNSADDVLRDAYASGRYRAAILTMTVIRRLDPRVQQTALQSSRLRSTASTQMTEGDG